MRVMTALVGLMLTLGPAPDATTAQPREKAARLGMLDPGRPPGGRCVPAFRQALRDLGYLEGQTIVLDARFADEDPARLSAIAADLARQSPDLLWTHSPQGAKAMRDATATIPIVVGVAGYLVEQGLAASAARPAGNITGFELGDIDLAGKRLQLLKEAVPAITRVAVLVDPAMRAYDAVPRNIESEARAIGVQLQRVEAVSPPAFEAAFAAMVRGRADGLMIADVPLFVRNGERLSELALRHRLPTISGFRRFAEAGIMMAFGANVPELCRRSALYVDRILKGAKPGDLPVEHPTKFELVVNRKTATALGLAIPPSLLIGADEVIR